MPDMTISTTANNAQRLSAAIGDIVNEDGSPASAAQVKGYTIKWLKSLVRAYERRQLEAQVSMPQDIDPT